MIAVIGLAGEKESGKDTAYKLLHNYLDDAAAASGDLALVEREGFADRLKLSFARMFYPDIELSEAIEFANHVKDLGQVLAFSQETEALVTGREVLQRYGTEAHRDVFDQDFWIKAVIDPSREDLGRPEDQHDVLVITDVRFPNEAEAVRACPNGQVWRINAGNRLGKRADAHASEIPLPDELVDVEIDNNGTLDELGYALAHAWETNVKSAIGVGW